RLTAPGRRRLAVLARLQTALGCMPVGPFAVTAVYRVFRTENATGTWDGIRRTAPGRRRMVMLARRQAALGSTSSPDGCAGRLARAPPENATDTWDGIRRLTVRGRRRIAVLARRQTALGST